MGNGIVLYDGATLRIYGQNEGTGKLKCSSNTSAGIGMPDANKHGRLIVYGGIIDAKGGNDCAGMGGARADNTLEITINGGTIFAQGGENGAGIGGALKGAGGTLTVNGGTVYAKGKGFAAGIGGGGSTENLVVQRVILAMLLRGSTRGDEVPDAGAGGTVNIHGGHVTAVSDSGYAIGAGQQRIVSQNTNESAIYAGQPARLTLEWKNEDDSLDAANINANPVIINTPFVYSSGTETFGSVDENIITGKEA